MQEGQGKEETTQREEERTTDADKQYQILSLIHSYSEFTLIDWDRVWDKSIVEFFNTLAFIREYKKREAEAAKKAMKK